MSLQVADAVEGEARFFGGLEAGVGGDRTPAVPLQFWIGGDLTGAIGAEGGGGWGGVGGGRSAKPVGDGFALGDGHRVGDGDHGAVVESARRMRVAGSFCRVSRVGMRGLFWSWQPAQCCLKTASPDSGAAACRPVQTIKRRKAACRAEASLLLVEGLRLYTNAQGTNGRSDGDFQADLA